MKLTIPKPCSENWDAMQDITKGKFCNLCSKQVIDFTNFTDEQIIQYFEQQGETCGRLTQKQIDRINLLLQKQSNDQPNLWRIFAWALSASTITSITTLQEVKAENTVYQEVINKKTPLQIIDTTKNTTSQSWIISGKVRAVSDSTDLLGVTVMIKGTSIGTITDLDGTYKLDISQFSNQSEVILVFSVIGFETQEHKITLQNITCDIALKAGDVFLGEMVLGGIHSGNFFQRTWWKTKYFVRRLFGAY
jgi:hypothetical protein